MEIMKKKILWLTFLVLAAGCWAQAQWSSGGIAVIVNRSNSTESMSMAQLRKLMLGDVRNWPDKKAVTVVARESSSKVSQTVLSSVVRLSEAEYRRYIMNAEFRGDDAMTVQTANSDLNAAKSVAASNGSIAFVEVGAVPAIASLVKVVRVNGKLPGEAGYPLEGAK
jgi:ABC-type phosphate transport system substrate-binding protein